MNRLLLVLVLFSLAGCGRQKVFEPPAVHPANAQMPPGAPLASSDVLDLSVRERVKIPDTGHAGGSMHHMKQGHRPHPGEAGGGMRMEDDKTMSDRDGSRHAGGNGKAQTPHHGMDHHGMDKEMK